MNYKKQTEKLYALRQQIADLIEQRNDGFKDVVIDDLWSFKCVDFKLCQSLRRRNSLNDSIFLLGFAYLCFVNSGEISS